MQPSVSTAVALMQAVQRCERVAVVLCCSCLVLSQAKIHFWRLRANVHFVCVRMVEVAIDVEVVLVVLVVVVVVVVVVVGVVEVDVVVVVVVVGEVVVVAVMAVLKLKTVDIGSSQLQPVN